MKYGNVLSELRFEGRVMKAKSACFLTIGILLIVFSQPSFAAENGAIDSGTTAWMLTSTALVLLMVPGLAMFYGGLVRTKNVLGTMMHSFVAMALIGVLGVVGGYSLAYGRGILVG